MRIDRIPFNRLTTPHIFQLNEAPRRSRARADVVAEQVVFVADVEFAGGNDWMRPCAFPGTVRLLEAAMLLVTVGTGLDEHERAFLLGANDETIVGVSEGAFACDAIGS